MLKLKIFWLITLIAAIYMLLSLNQGSESLYHNNLHIYTNSISRKYEKMSFTKVVQQQYNFLKLSMKDYPFPPNTTLRNFSQTTGGKPLRNIIIATWRSGSTFLGEIINALPGNYYHYEPLMFDYSPVRIRGPPNAKLALQNLKQLLNCDYKDYNDSLVLRAPKFGYLLSLNTRLWNVCKKYSDYCWIPTFLNEFCKLFPFHTMKILRLTLELAEELLKDKSLNVRILLLMRDPRGILQSRKHTNWCYGLPDCDQAGVLCTDMVSDYIAATKFKKFYPSQFSVIRYEELSMEPQKTVKNILKFFGLYFHQQVKIFLDEHTKFHLNGLYSTFRNSATVPFKWKTNLNYFEVHIIQKSCARAMKLWGYVMAYNESHLREFYPLTQYTIEEKN